MKGNTSNQGFTEFFNVVYGRFVQRVPEGTEGAVTRTNKNEKEVHELHFNFVGGKLVDVKKETNDFQEESLIITFKDADETGVLTLGFYDRPVRTVLNKLCNVDLSRSVVFHIGTDNEGKTWMTVKQDDEKVPNKFDKEQMPDPVQIKIKGRDTWNYDGLADFLWEEFQKVWNAKPDATQTVSADSDQEGGDDLPFWS